MVKKQGPIIFLIFRDIISCMMFYIISQKKKKASVGMERSASIKKQPIKCQKQYGTLCVAPQTFTSAYGERKWLKRHGKQERINFSDDALSKLRKYFDSLDSEGKGSLGVEELQDPFIAFGLSENREQVQKLIQSVDEDGSGKIEFDEFLGIMLNIKRGNATGKSNNSAMFDFFKRLSSNDMGSLYNKDISFRMNVSQERRKQMMQSLMSGVKEKKEKGMKILENFKNQVMSNSQLKEQLFQSKKSNIYIYGFQREKNV